MTKASESIDKVKEKTIAAKDKVMATPYIGKTLSAASKGASFLYDKTAKLGGYQDPEETKKDDKPIVMSNSSNSNTTNNTTINKYDTDTISRWRSGYVDQVHKPGHYSMYS